MLQPSEAVIPYDDTRLLSGSSDRIDRYPGLAEWWSDAEQIWDQNKGAANRLSLLERLDYHGELSAQFPVPPYRVVYTKAGNYLTAGIVADPQGVIDHMLYWAAANSLDEARYLAVILNAPALAEACFPSADYRYAVSA